MRIPLGIPKGPAQARFLDHLNSIFRSSLSWGTGYAESHEDGTFESAVAGELSVEGNTVTLEWKIIKSSNGTLEAIEVKNPDSEVDDPIWRETAHELIHKAQSSALSNKLKTFFCRKLFYYIGPQLDGEYWLPGYRFAPAYPDDPEPVMVNAERVVYFDMKIQAIDKYCAEALADERAKRHAARMSLLLNVGLYLRQSELRWVLIPKGEKSERYSLGFSSPSPCKPIRKMPEKKELCDLGEYKGSLNAYYYRGKLSLPQHVLVQRDLDISSFGFSELLYWVF